MKSAKKINGVKSTGRSRNLWSAAALKELKRLVKKKVPVREIAKQLTRTDGAIRQKLHSEGIRLR